jgi:16S rRNA (guanine(966)-N(2))-methyltransferase RsmD
MRIISGTHKSRHINPPIKLPVRPTTDFAKESIFDVMNNYFDFNGLSVLDLFAGTGNISYEFASRGCEKVTAIEQDFHCTRFIEETKIKMGLNAIHVIKANVFSCLITTKAKYNIIFADPPYDMIGYDKIPTLVFENEMLLPNGWLIIEHSRDTDFSKNEHLFQHRMYGKVNFSIFIASE